jgi:hypothetical protein
MSQKVPEIPEDYMSVKDMREMMQDEITRVMKAGQLRIEELSAITTAFAAGELTPKQATEKYFDHMDKWGDVLPEVTSIERKTDEQIRAAVDGKFASHLERHGLRKSKNTSTGGFGRGEQ